MTPNIYNLSYQEIQKVMSVWDEPDYRARQIWEGLYKQLWFAAEQFSTIPLPLRNQLNQEFDFEGLIEEESITSSDSFTIKNLYRLPDDHKIEMVIMKYADRNTACISSQVGCGIGCAFCATGYMGFKRNLNRGEIIQQVIRAALDLKHDNQKLSNVVFMGMGEPFANYQNLIDAIQILNSPFGFNMGARRFTISTVGLIPGIRRFTEENHQVNLAISLHAADDELRDSLIPINRKYPIPDLMEACVNYIDKTNRRVTIEWALIGGVNDSLEQAQKLVDLIRGRLFHVNLIQLNPVEHYEGDPSADQTARAIQAVLNDAEIPCTIRLRRGIDISAGCGQLVIKEG